MKTRQARLHDGGQRAGLRNFAEMIARAKHRWLQPRHLGFERKPHGLREAVRRLHHDVDNELPAGHGGLLALALPVRGSPDGPAGSCDGAHLGAC